MEGLLTAISTVGFPIVVAMYTLIKLEKTIHANTIIMTKVYERLGGDILND